MRESTWTSVSTFLNDLRRSQVATLHQQISRLADSIHARTINLTTNDAHNASPRRTVSRASCSYSFIWSVEQGEAHADAFLLRAPKYRRAKHDVADRESTMPKHDAPI